MTAYRSKEEVEQVGRTRSSHPPTARQAHRQTTGRQAQGLRRGMAARGGQHRALHWLWREVIGLCGGCMLVLLQEGKEISRTFEHIPSSVGALEAEEVPPHMMKIDRTYPPTYRRALNAAGCLCGRWAWSTCFGTSTTPPSARSPTRYHQPTPQHQQQAGRQARERAASSGACRADEEGVGLLLVLAHVRSSTRWWRCRGSRRSWARSTPTCSTSRAASCPSTTR